MKLNLEKLIMSNLGPFKGKVSMEFSQDDKKQVTYIIGKNSAGKSMVFNAIYWCLFNTPKDDDLKALVNKEALKNKEKEMYVRLKFNIIDDYNIKTEYEIKRTINFEAEGDDTDYSPKGLQGNFTASKFTPYSDQPLYMAEKDFINFIDNIIPPGPRQFFFLDGEKLAALFKKEHLGKIESYANDISDIGLIGNMIKNLDHLYADLDKKCSRLDHASADLASDRDKCEKLEKELKGYKETEEKILGEIDDKSELKYQLEEECRAHRDLEPHIIAARELEKTKAIKETERNLKWDEFKRFLSNNLFLVLLEDQIIWCEKEVKKLQEAKVFPPDIPKDILNKMVSTGFCICGEELKKEKLLEFSKLNDTTPDGNLTTKYNDFSRDLHLKKESIENIKSKIRSSLVRLSGLNYEINSLKIKISQEKKFIPPGFNDSNYLDKLRRIKSLDGEISDQENRLPTIRNSILYRSEDIKNLRKTLDSKRDKNSEAGKIRFKLAFIKELSDFSKKMRDNVKNSLLSHVQLNTSDAFRSLVWDPANWREIRISDRWVFTAITSNGFTLSSFNLSEGQKHVLGIAFMSSLGKVTGNLLPFVFDSPFGRVSQDPIEKIGKNIRILMKDRQVTLLVTDTENDNIREHIAEIIGKEYNVRKISATESMIEEA